MNTETGNTETDNTETDNIETDYNETDNTETENIGTQKQDKNILRQAFPFQRAKQKILSNCNRMVFFYF